MSAKQERKSRAELQAKIDALEAMVSGLEEDLAMEPMAYCRACGMPTPETERDEDLARALHAAGLREMNEGRSAQEVVIEYIERLHAKP